MTGAAESIARALGGKLVGQWWRCHCPVHQSDGLSLALRDLNGGVAYKCHGGCSDADVLAKLREMKLWPEAPACSVANYAARLNVGESFLRDPFGITDSKQYGASCRIPYFDETGHEVAIRYRIALDGTDKFRWARNAKPSLYGLQLINIARNSDEIAIVEGESDCITLWWEGCTPAVGLPGAASWREERDARYFDVFKKIFVVIEPDKGGE